SEHNLLQAKEEIYKNLRFQHLFHPSQSPESIDITMEQIALTSEYASLAQADLIIENVTEKWDIKEAVYRQIDSICREDCIFAVNTSAIPITRIGSVTKRPDRVIGMHFMNPVP